MTVDEIITYCSDMMNQYNKWANNYRRENYDDDSETPEELRLHSTRYKEIVEYLTELKEFKENSKWHKVNEELPKESGKYLCCTESGDIFEAYFDSEIAEYDKNEFPFGEYRDIFDSNTLGYVDSEWCAFDSIIYWRNPVPIPKELEEELN